MLLKASIAMYFLSGGSTSRAPTVLESLEHTREKSLVERHKACREGGLRMQPGDWLRTCDPGGVLLEQI